ncbi:MAG TPA: hypothetical protein VNA17_03405 [Pyrinomonadaceae bacterium]|nr:hypothetical protein [Pyrinomonadaceae bacterium]
MDETDIDRRMQSTTIRMSDGRRYLIYYTFDRERGPDTEARDNAERPREDPEPA